MNENNERLTIYQVAHTFQDTATWWANADSITVTIRRYIIGAATVRFYLKVELPGQTHEWFDFDKQYDQVIAVMKSVGRP